MPPEAFARRTDIGGFPSALTLYADNSDDYEGAQNQEAPWLVAELRIMELMATIRNKPQWWMKVLDSTIVEQWRTKVLTQLLEDPGFPENPHNGTAREHYAEQHFDYALAECQWLAGKYATGPSRPAAVEGVFGRQDLSVDLLEGLQTALMTLRSKSSVFLGCNDVDRHPGTPQMVDLVHPSLYCYQRKVTPVLSDRGAEVYVASREELFDNPPTVVEEDLPSEEQAAISQLIYNLTSKQGLQWLPAEFRVSSDGSECEINSYINSLHPTESAEVYTLTKKLFLHTVPLLEDVLKELGPAPEGRDDSFRQRRRRLTADPYEWWTTSPDHVYPHDSDSENFDEDERWDFEQDHRVLIQPTIPNFTEPCYTKPARIDFTLRDRPLQVIVKYASLELTPGETYNGGSWHVEGTLEERIVATACCYLESTNIVGGNLAFRAAVSEPDYEQSDDDGIRQMYNLANEEALVQSLSSCVTPQGSILAWPNTMQHRVEDIQLADPTRPGKRTVACFFLVDPTLRIRSTATVPPQLFSWFRLASEPSMAKVLQEAAIRDKVYHYSEYTGATSEADQQVQSVQTSSNATRVDETADAANTTTPTSNTVAPSPQPLLTYQQACDRRLALMEERREMFHRDSDHGDSGFYQINFSLCEH